MCTNRFTKKTYVAVMALAAASLLGCAGTVKTQWAKQIQQLDINPVFPPREDVQVGDIYLVCPAFGETFFGSEKNTRSVYLGTIGLKKELAAYYKERFEVPEVVQATPTQPPAGVPAVASLGSFKQGSETEDIFNVPGSRTRLRNVAFPDVLSVKLQEGEVQALVPAGVTMANASLGASSYKMGSLSVPSASEYGVPLDILNARLQASEFAALRAFLAKIEGALPDRCGNGGTPRLDVVQSVYLANSITLKLETQASAGATAEVNYLIPDAATAARTFSAVLKAWSKEDGAGAAGGGTGTAATGSGTASAPKAVFSDAQADALAQKLTNQLQTTVPDLQSTSEESLPGVKVSYRVGRSGAITMDRRFTHPVVIGVRSVSLKTQGERLYIALTTSSESNETVFVRGPVFLTK